MMIHHCNDLVSTTVYKYGKCNAVYTFRFIGTVRDICGQMFKEPSVTIRIVG
jgi:hypothetical protein